MSSSSESNRHWITWILGAALTLMLGVGSIGYSSMSSRIDRVENLLETVRSEKASKEAVEQYYSDSLRYIDTRLKTVEYAQQETSRQLGILVEDQKAFQKELRLQFSK